MRKISLSPKTVKISEFDFDYARKTYLSKKYCNNLPFVHTKKTMSQPPWISDGIVLIDDATLYKTKIDSWGICKRAYKIDIIPIIADFYLLEAIQTTTPEVIFINPLIVEELVKSGIRPTNSSNQIFVLQAIFLQNRLIRHYLPVFRAHMWYSIAGELAHHPSSKIYFHSSRNEREIREVWFKIVKRFGGEQSAKWAQQLFRDGETVDKKTGWIGSYGGLPWAECANILYLLEKGQCYNKTFTGKHFMDRVFNAEHNSGTIFSKVSWKKENYALRELLSAHGNDDFDTLLDYCSCMVHNLWIDMKSNKPSRKFNWRTKYPL